MDSAAVVNIVMYGLLVAFTVFRFMFEMKDVKCPDVFNSTEQECKEYGGMCYSYTKPNENDTCETLLKKISKAGGAECRSIKWRRALFLSVVIMFAIWILVITPGSLPVWTTMYLCVMISFAILYMVLNWYSAHVYNQPSEWIDQSIDMLRKKGVCNIDNPPSL